jgi:hypothetical protein
VVELKAVKDITDVHLVRSYLRAVGRKRGLILNFAKPTLEVKRVFGSPSLPALPAFLSGPSPEARGD